MNVWMFVGSLVPAVLVAFAVGSRLYGNVPAWLARAGFLVTACLATAALYWVYHRLDQTATTLVVVGSLAYLSVFTVSAEGLIEDNAPPQAPIREQILAFHAAANLRYRREPRGKRAFDFIVASVGIVVTLPLWFLIALFIWFEEPGPIFFTKNSVGRAGITFRELKFRSMHVEAERNTGPVVATFEDPRVLLIGRVIRRWHLDEMPEVLNVVSGKMSLVGPRPLRAVVVRRNLEEVPGFAERHTVRPGIACIAQIEKAHVEPAERLHKDLVYIRRMSLAFDIRLLVRAVVSTLRGAREPAPRPAIDLSDEAVGQTIDFDAELETIRLDARRLAVLSPDDRQRAAFHESGHALLAMLAPDADPALETPILRSGHVSMDQGAADPYGCSARWLRRWIVSALGGRAAEEVVFGDTTAGAENELDQVSDIARQMVGRSRTPDASAPAGAASELPRGADDMTPSAAGLADGEARRIVDECYAQAVSTLSEHREQLHSLAYALLARNTPGEHTAYAVAGTPRPTPNADSGAFG